MPDGQPNTIKVLSVDGGGIRGIIPAVLLGEIQKRLSKELCQTFDLIAGTSTGGIIALGLGTLCNNGKPYTPDQLLNLYLQNGSAIFQKSWLTPLRQLLFPKYSVDGLQKTLTRFFQSTEFCTAQTPLLISSYNLQKQMPFFFKSHLIAARPDYNWKVVDIARATSAAPTFFPPFHLVRGADDYALVDGGVFVNNPSMAAFVEARLLYPDRLQVSGLPLAAGQMDNVSPDNLVTLQTLAKNYLAANSSQFDQVCAELKPGRGSNMPGIGRPAGGQ